MNPRVDTEGDGELRTQIAKALFGTVEQRVGDAPWNVGPWEQLGNDAHRYWLNQADAVLGVFGDVERELARLREAAEGVIAASRLTTMGRKLRAAINALRAVLASAVQSEHPKQ